MRRRVVSRRRHAPSEDRVCGRDAPRRAPVRGFHVYAIETIRGVLVRGASLAHHRRPEARARVFLPTFHEMFNSTSERSFFCRQLATPRQCHCCHVRRSLFVTAIRAACTRNAARREHEPRDDRPKPGRRGDPRAPARRRAPPVRRGGAPGGWHRLQSLRRVGSPRHAVRGLRVRGGQDRQRAGRHPRRFAGRARARRGAPARLRAPARTHAFSVSRHTPSADTRILRLAFSSSRGLARAFCAFGKPRSCSTRLSRSARLALQPRASDAFRPSFSVRLLCDRSPPRRRRRRNASPAR